MATKRTSDVIAYPGEFLSRELAARGWSQRRLANELDRPPQVISEIVRGKRRMTADIAISLERIWGTPAQVWVNLQGQYDIARARKDEQERVASATSA